MTAKITVSLPVFNGANFIECAIKSILGQTCKNISLLISDNHSTDDTRAIVEKYMGDGRITLIARPTNVGMYRNSMENIERITSDYLMILSHDDFFYNDTALEKALDILEKNPDLPVVYCDTMFVDKYGKGIATRKSGFSGLTENDRVAKKCIVRGRNFFGIPLLIRTKSLQGVKFSEKYVHSNDIDFCISLGKGKKVWFIPETMLALRFHGENNTARAFESVGQEFLEIAKDQGIKLSGADRILMKLHDRFNYVMKKAFFFYLDTMRR